jgi:hypothetical protein
LFDGKFSREFSIKQLFSHVHLSCFTLSSQCFDAVKPLLSPSHQAVFIISRLKTELEKPIFRFQLLWIASSERRSFVRIILCAVICPARLLNSKQRT